MQESVDVNPVVVAEAEDQKEKDAIKTALLEQLRKIKEQTAQIENQLASPANVTCNFANLAAAEAGKLETSVTINDLNNNQGLLNPPRSRAMMQNVTSLSNQTFTAALINPTTHNLINWVNRAANPAGTRLAAWMANPITITPAQALAPNFTLTFSNSRGISTRSNTVNQINGVHPGAFDMVLSIQ